LRLVRDNNDYFVRKMKRIVLLLLAIVMCFGLINAQSKNADIKFKATTYNFGKFSEEHPVVTCSFVFTNTGDAPLVVHQVIPSCGCTVADYPKQPIMPGKQSSIKVTYNGTGHYPGMIHKYVTVHTNAKTGDIRLYIEGEMTAKN
jgi:hypothetical protein